MSCQFFFYYLVCTCRVGVFFFLVMNMIFGNLSAVELFIKERPIFMYVSVYVIMLKIQVPTEEQLVTISVKFLNKASTRAQGTLNVSDLQSF